jgi:hypothetical protein
VSQGGGIGGFNQQNRGCIDWLQVLEAGKGGTLGAVESLVSIPLGITYMYAALVYGQSPTEVNEILLSPFGLDDEYRVASNNPYYIAGRGGGSAAVSYISLGTFLKGLPNLSWSGGTQIGSLTANQGMIFLTNGNVTIVGGNGALVYAGAAGEASSMLSLIAQNGGRGGNYNTPIYGSPQKGTTPEHNAKVEEIVRELDNSGEYEVIWIDKQIKIPTKGQVPARGEPDVLALNFTKKRAYLVEVPSPSQKLKFGGYTQQFYRTIEMAVDEFKSQGWTITFDIIEP